MEETTHTDTTTTDTRRLVLPVPLSNPDGPKEISVKSSVVIVGANGSGKTRLGTWIDLQSPQKNLVHRLSAQKSLTMPEMCSTSSMEIAESTLLYGHMQGVQHPEYKSSQRWQSKPNTILQNDYEKLLTYLFTEEFDKSTKYRQHAKITEQPGKPPETRFDIIKHIWEAVLPHRELIIGGGQIKVRSEIGGATPYNASEMSDGERVIFYLIGQSLAAKKNGILVIDEPELHLHRALQSRLWDAVEAERPDCLFIYLTHDLDFAATRANATKIWLKGYENEHWDWHLVPSNDDIPERLLLEVLGSRKPVLFVEGDKDSLDYFLFSHLFNNHTIAPCGSASAVIHSTRSFSNLKHLHDLECQGVIDRDFRSNEQVEYLRGMRVFCLAVSEIENLLLTENVLMEVSRSLHRTDTDIIISKTKGLVFSYIEREQERLISAIVAAQIEDSLSRFDAKALGEAALTQALNDTFSSVSLSDIYSTVTNNVKTILIDQNYPDALRLYNNKGLLPQVSGLFGLKSHELTEFIKRLIASKDNQRITTALRETLPELRDLVAVPEIPNVS